MVVYLEYCIVYKLSCAIVWSYLMYLVQVTVYPPTSFSCSLHAHPSIPAECWKRVYLKLDPHRFTVLEVAHAEKSVEAMLCCYEVGDQGRTHALPKNSQWRTK